MTLAVRDKGGLELLVELEQAGALTPTALTLDPDTNYDTWEALGGMLGQLHRAATWLIADWLNFGERVYGETYAQGVEATGLTPETLMEYAWVARSIPPSRRRENLSFSTHRLVASFPAREQERWLKRCEKEGWSRRELARNLDPDLGLDVHYSSETAEWSTPQEVFEALDGEFGFTLDVCATAENAKCSSYYTEVEDGLVQDWQGVCWMNPPYGKVIGVWVAKAWESAQNGATVVCLVPARVDTRWWWDYCRFGEIRFLRGRLKFGDGSNAAPFPSAVVIFPREPCVVWWER